MEGHPVIHLVSELNGHHMHPDSKHAHDCWCEPAKLFWVRNNYGILVLVVEHNDYFPVQQRHIQLRDQEQGIPVELAWINHALYDPTTYPAAPHRDIKARRSRTGDDTCL